MMDAEVKGFQECNPEENIKLNLEMWAFLFEKREIISAAAK